MRRGRSLCFGLRRRKNSQSALSNRHWLFRVLFHDFYFSGRNPNHVMKTNEHPADSLEDRLIDFAVRIIAIAAQLRPTRASDHISRQILRSGTAPAPNYGEA